jgi:hypothetical protein
MYQTDEDSRMNDEDELPVVSLSPSIAFAVQHKRGASSSHMQEKARLKENAQK